MCLLINLKQTYANNSQAVVIRGPIEGLKVSQATVDDSLNIVDVSKRFASI